MTPWAGKRPPAPAQRRDGGPLPFQARGGVAIPVPAGPPAGWSRRRSRIPALDAGRVGCDPGRVRDLVTVGRSDDDTLWAVYATLGRTSRVAEVFRSRAAALADRDWRAQQVRAYEDFLRRSGQPVPHYSVAPIKRHDLPRKWTPLPALGFLRGQFI